MAATKRRAYRLSDADMQLLATIVAYHALDTETDAIRMLIRKEARRIAADDPVETPAYSAPTSGGFILPPDDGEE